MFKPVSSEAPRAIVRMLVTRMATMLVGILGELLHAYHALITYNSGALPLFVRLAGAEQRS